MRRTRQFKQNCSCSCTVTQAVQGLLLSWRRITFSVRKTQLFIEMASFRCHSAIVVQSKVKTLNENILCIKNAFNTTTPMNCKVLNVSFMGDVMCFHSIDAAFDVEVKQWTHVSSQVTTWLRNSGQKLNRCCIAGTNVWITMVSMQTNRWFVH
jgi:hypothetical protein